MPRAGKCHPVAPEIRRISLGPVVRPGVYSRAGVLPVGYSPPPTPAHGPGAARKGFEFEEIPDTRMAGPGRIPGGGPDRREPGSGRNPAGVRRLGVEPMLVGQPGRTLERREPVGPGREDYGSGHRFGLQPVPL